MRALRYAFQEALASLWRGRAASCLSILTIAIALFVLGGFLVAAANLERLVATWAEAAELSVFLADEISQEERQAVDRVLTASPMVRAREYVSKTEARERFKRDFPDLAVAAGSLSHNPFPASFEARLASRPSGRFAGDAVDRLALRLRQMPGVADVRYDRRWIERLSDAARVVRLAGYGMGGLLIAAAALTVASVVRLALLGRRDEIKIMELVGAPLAAVRGPFVVEGVLHGGIGAVAGLGALWGAVGLVRARGSGMVDGLVDLGGTRFLEPDLIGMLLAGGMIVGCIGGFVAARGRGRQLVS